MRSLLFFGIACLALFAAGCGKSEQPAKPDPAQIKAEQEKLFRCRACGKTVKNSEIMRSSQTAGKCPACGRIAPMVPVK